MQFILKRRLLRKRVLLIPDCFAKHIAIGKGYIGLSNRIKAALLLTRLLLQ